MREHADYVTSFGAATVRARFARPAVLLLMIAGCHEAPKTFTAADLQDPDVRAEAAHLYWKQHNVPPLDEEGYSRLAIVEFAVEFVTDKWEFPLETQPKATVPAVTPAGAGLALAGIERKQIIFEESMHQRLPNELHDILVDALQRRGFDVFSAARVTATDAYRKFNTIPFQASPALLHMNFIGSDTGRIKHLKTYPAGGFRLLTGVTDGAVETVEQELLEELDADVSLRVRVRVGVFRGRASLESGSHVLFLARDRVGDVTADRSLLSDEMVVEEKNFQLFHGERYTVGTEQYLSAMRSLFPTFMDMALQAEASPQG